MLVPADCDPQGLPLFSVPASAGGRMRGICRVYVSQGICRLGERCIYEHPTQEDISLVHTQHLENAQQPTSIRQNQTLTAGPPAGSEGNGLTNTVVQPHVAPTQHLGLAFSGTAQAHGDRNMNQHSSGALSGMNIQHADPNQVFAFLQLANAIQSGGFAVNQPLQSGGSLHTSVIQTGASIYQSPIQAQFQSVDAPGYFMGQAVLPNVNQTIVPANTGHYGLVSPAVPVALAPPLAPAICPSDYEPVSGIRFRAGIS
ncbi:hypothetical protein HGRIS_012411 [Hohenbuehelia grisea]|uniref:C3H1-type domain-containing protein n=1 Tax=Hohenbuehelia grisea TaxID=104357 RepID=A0ABR3IS62_9AGAR